jgi:hypothetical protein
MAPPSLAEKNGRWNDLVKFNQQIAHRIVKLSSALPPKVAKVLFPSNNVIAYTMLHIGGDIVHTFDGIEPYEQGIRRVAGDPRIPWGKFLIDLTLMNYRLSIYHTDVRASATVKGKPAWFFESEQTKSRKSQYVMTLLNDIQGVLQYIQRVQSTAADLLKALRKDPTVGQDILVMLEGIEFTFQTVQMITNSALQRSPDYICTGCKQKTFDEMVQHPKKNIMIQTMHGCKCSVVNDNHHITTEQRDSVFESGKRNATKEKALVKMFKRELVTALQDMPLGSSAITEQILGRQTRRNPSSSSPPSLSSSWSDNGSDWGTPEEWQPGSFSPISDWGPPNV